MLKNIVVIENDLSIQCDTLEELVKLLIDEKYYEMTEIKKIERMEMKALANCINNKMEIIKEQDINEQENLDNKFIIKDEFTYILSLLQTNKIILLERKDASILTKDLEKDNIKDNYIIVNTFAKELLIKYLKQNKF